MTAAQLFDDNISCISTSSRRRWSILKKTSGSYSRGQFGGIYHSSLSTAQKGCEDVCRHCHLSAEKRKSFEAVVQGRKPFQNVLYNRVSSDQSVEPCDVEPLEEEPHDLEDTTLEKDEGVNSLSESTYPPLLPNKSHSAKVKRELVMLSLPAVASQAIDPFAQLMETAFIGRLGIVLYGYVIALAGPVQLASAGVSISIFNIISKLFNMPLLSVSTSFVAEDIAKYTSENTNGNVHHRECQRKQLSSVSTALLLAAGIGIIESLALFLGSGPFLSLMGVSSDSPMRASAQRFLSLRALGAPAVVLSLALQGILRGFKDTKTPVLCLGAANLAAVFLFPLLVNYFQMGIAGAAIATVLSQYIGSFLMMWCLSKRAILLPPKLGDLRFGVYLKSGGYLIGRTMAVLITTTLGTSMAARQGPIAMAAHQICVQVWLAVSLLTDALAASAQALVASSLSRGDYNTVKELTNFVLKIGILTGTVLAAILGSSFGSLANVFTKDTGVLEVVKTGTLFVSASQPVNALAFIFDGLHYGASDFRYAACSTMLVGAVSSAVLLFATSIFGLPGVWLGLTVFMGLRLAAGYVRILSRNGPWWFLHRDSLQIAGA